MKMSEKWLLKGEDITKGLDKKILDKNKWKKKFKEGDEDGKKMWKSRSFIIEPKVAADETS